MLLVIGAFVLLAVVFFAGRILGYDAGYQDGVMHMYREIKDQEGR